MRKREVNLKWFENLDIFKVSLFIGVFLIIAYLVVPIIMSLMYHVVRHDVQSGQNCDTIEGMYNEHTGQIGDTIGGTFGPLIGALGVMLTFWAFWAQFKANRQQTRDLQSERFESRLFSMLETHRNNVDAIIIDGFEREDIVQEVPTTSTDGKVIFQCISGNSSKEIRGRKAFVSMFDELRFLMDLTTGYKNSKECAEDLKTLKVDDVYEVAYLIFFFGAEGESEKVGSDLVLGNRWKLLSCVCGQLRILQDAIISGKILLQPVGTILGYEKDVPTKYLPGLGQMANLSHYFRHLFLMVDYVDSQPSDLLAPEEKYKYVRLIRAQMSIHEQLMVFYNALSILGAPWLHEKRKLMHTYCLVKSIPLPLAKLYKDPIAVLGRENPNKKAMFEWLEIQERLKQDVPTTPTQG